ncbi:nitrogen fixation protein VnfA [bacterium BMS3Abin07]|nr:nitrogen fixation protein VnfA [bacterium BMS3Abin07]GBE32392.1 nitrogen fixation protein VnfA [bacterium BMS3Bbin05]HDL20095.1 nif-specific transcriptional activator NifA [Nitrospirota bacterium]HDO22443.1 nif-specific transcriptional activator NifA [Nitrospirota bacterium]HDZ87485.1 nif-specific transcriptional activator NifA [Nitrospirota bacterium]
MKRDYKTIELTALYEISKILGSSLNLKTNLRGVLRVLSEYLDMKRGTVALRKGSEVSIESAVGMTADEIRRGRYKLGEGIIGRVAKHGSPIVIPNVGDEPLFLNRTGARKKIKNEDIAYLCVPIKFKNETLGVLSVDRLFKGGLISFEEDLRLLKIIASLIAYSVKLHNEMEREREAFIEEKNKLTRQLKGKYRVENIIGQSDSMQEVFEAVHSVAPARANVILRGESGTGKELVAKAIHFMSPRAKEPFIKFNCASIPEGLLESELFGHEKGAFTGATAMRKGRFELADRGTIFLDEIGDLPLSLQPKILRVLQEREFERVGGEKTIKVNVRLVAATSRNIEKLVSDGHFREDLYYRLNVVPIFMPPLRERREDIPLLMEFFLDRFNRENGKSISITTGVLDILVNYEWPGNVRELENAIERLVVMSKGKKITVTDLPLDIRHGRSRSASLLRGTLSSTVEEMEKERIIDALEKSAWIQARAARLLGITSRQIGYKIRKHKIGKTR